MMAGPAALAVQTGAALMPVTLWFDEDGWGRCTSARRSRCPLRARKEKVAAMMQQVARVFEHGITEHPQDWHMLQRVFVADLDPDRLAAAARAGRTVRPDGQAEAVHEDRPGLPVHLGRARRGAGAHQGPGRGADRPRARGLGDLPGGRGHPAARTTWCQPAAPCRCPTTARWPGCRSASCRPAGSGGGSRRATSTCCTCTSPPRRACRCWPAGSLTGPIVATVHTANPRSRALHAAQPILQSALEKISGRIAVSEAARTTLVEHLGGDAVLIPNGVSVRRYQNADPLPGWPGDGRRAGLPRPDGRAAQGPAVLLEAFEMLGAGAAGPAAAHRRPRRRRARCWTRCPPQLRDRVVLLGQVSERGQGPRATTRWTCSARRTPAARASASCWPRRWPRARRSWPATWTRSGGCCAAARRASCSRSATRPSWPARRAGCSTTRRGGPRCRPRPPRRCGRTTGRWWRGTCCGSTRP